MLVASEFGHVFSAVLGILQLAVLEGQVEHQSLTSDLHFCDLLSSEEVAIVVPAYVGAELFIGHEQTAKNEIVISQLVGRRHGSGPCGSAFS